jgi:filamentous hemagglutinin family protein
MNKSLNPTSVGPTLVRRLALLVLASCMPLAGAAQIVTDTSLGRPAQTLTGPTYRITESLGKLAGSNLFHSFQTFNLGLGEYALFSTTTPTINNVISRVTSGVPSEINGTVALRAAAGLPSFYFINPAGVLFGTGASIDVPGAFHAGSADYIGFPDGRFHADPGKSSTFSSHPPQAFGFVGEHRTSISLTAGADLWAHEGSNVSLVAGDISIDAARVKSDGGHLRIGAMGAPAVEVPFVGELPSGQGSLRVTNGGLLTVSSACCGLTGSIKVSAGNVLLDGSGAALYGTGIFGSTLNQDSDAATLNIAARDNFTLRGGATVTALSRTGGAGGNITIASPLVTISNADMDVTAQSRGRAGVVNISGTKVSLVDGGRIFADARSTGDAGKVSIRASESIEIGHSNDAGDRSSIAVQTSKSVQPGQVELFAPLIRLYDDGMISGYAESNSRTAKITITARDLLLVNGGRIYSFGLYTPGGEVTIDASNSVTIRGKNEAPSSSPGSDTVSTGIIGHATQVLVRSPQITVSEAGAIRAENWYANAPGYIAIQTDRLTLQSGGHISTNALGHSGTSGRGGTIVIRAAESIKVEGSSSNHRDSSIASGSRSGNDAGRIDIATPWLYVADLGVINTGTGRFGESEAGRIDIAVDRLDLVNGGRLASIEFGHTASGGHIAVNARESIALDGGMIIAQGANEAAAGRIVLAAPVISLRNGLITTSNSEDALSGGIEITTQRLSLSETARIESSSTGSYGAGNIALHVGESARFSDSAITTTSDTGSGGNVSLDGGAATRSGAVSLRNSVITTSVLGHSSDGNGGDIALSAAALAIDRGFIQANTVVSNASGGNININVSSLLPSGNILFVGGQTPYEFQSGLANFNVIQAAAPTGINGAINISSPALDISGSLAGLNTSLIEIGGLGRSPCQPSVGSSLVQVGRGGFAPAARNLLGIDSPAPPSALPASRQRPLSRLVSRSGCI